MKKRYIIANWKSYKTSQEAKEWLEKFSTFNSQQFSDDYKEVIICPPFHLLSLVHHEVARLKFPFKIGAQDVSPFPKGAYTGEVSADQLKEFAEYCIIGHSERRKYFKEEAMILANKVDMVKQSGIMPIFCVRDDSDEVPKNVTLVAYEPVGAIGSGNPDSPDDANTVAESIKSSKKVSFVLYGGSVTGDNVNQFTSKDSIDGILVGSASLDPNEFFHIIQNA